MKYSRMVLWVLAVLSVTVGHAADDADRRPRLRDLRISIGVLKTGPTNSLTDVAGVAVGHHTIRDGDAVRTGVTAVKPHPGNAFLEKVPAAIRVANGFGKFVGTTQVEELGVLETPIMLTNTLSTFAVADALVAWTLKQPGCKAVRSVNPVVGECNDGYLNDIRRRVVTREHVIAALKNANTRQVEEGCIGAGTGVRCMGWKGGIGSSSRVIPDALGGYTVGVLVQTNFGGSLTVAGVPVGRSLGRYYLKEHATPHEHGSCIVIVATDAPLDARQLKRLARRAPLGLAAAGSPISHGSGDYVLAFSTAEQFENELPIGRGRRAICTAARRSHDAAVSGGQRRNGRGGHQQSAESDDHHGTQGTRRRRYQSGPSGRGVPEAWCSSCG